MEAKRTPGPYTPGPWQCVPTARKDKATGATRKAWHISCPTHVVATTAGDAEANALLIAAGPDMLRDLEGIVHFSDGFLVYYDNGPLGKSLREWIESAKATIAKATGGAP
jgi:hypothetical protein